MKEKKKALSNGKKFIVIIFFSISCIFTGIFLGFFIKFFYLGITENNKDLYDESFIDLIFVFIIGLVFFISTIILSCSYDKNKKEKNIKWYIDKILIAYTPVWMTVAMVLFSFYRDEKQTIFLFFSIIIFLIIGLLTTPNAVLYAINDMKNWQSIFYDNGSLAGAKAVKGFYRVDTPVSFERKIYFAVIKEQLLNISTVALCMGFILMVALFNKSYNRVGTPGDLLYAIINTKAIRAEGYFFFAAVFIAAFWIPIFAYYITNALYKLRVVRRHEYIAYHAIVDKVDTFKIRINNSKVNYKYDYCTCVGIKSKDINKTKAILIFIPDDLILFPDKE